MSQNKQGILGDLAPAPDKARLIIVRESDDARRIREFRQMQQSFGARVMPLSATFH